MNFRALIKISAIFVFLIIFVTTNAGFAFATNTSANVSGRSSEVSTYGYNYGYVGVVTAGALNVREGPGPQHSSLTVIYQGQSVELVGRNFTGNWVKVRLNNGLEGWVNASYLYLSVPVHTLPIVTAPSEDYNAVVNTGAANVRYGPGVAYAPLTVVTNGTHLVALGRNFDSSWMYVRTPNGVIGWINASLTQKFINVNSLPVVAHAPSLPVYPVHPIYPEPTPPVHNVGHVSTGALNVRSGPGVAHHSIAVLSNGEQVVLLGRNSNSTWVQIQIPNGAVGWVNVSHVQTSVYIPSLPIIDAPPIPAYSPTAVVETGALHVRNGPGPWYSVISALIRGQVVALRGRNSANSWVQIVTPNGGIGWVNAVYVKTSVPVSSLPITG
jgi:uncharacterized protein YgiM (DUF1202 family)